jgi:alkanesulfonate monooxygenase SsuD/methylene tetrahydromethanopterin reductase-like flavin-dependent oxidoreductase (luciferase family)
MRDFDVAVTVPAVFGADVGRCADQLRPYVARYVGGMGSRTSNFYNNLAVRMGYADAAKRVQDPYLSRQYAAAASAAPFDLIDGTSLIGPVERVAGRLRAYAEAGVTTLNLIDVTEQDPVVPVERLMESASIAGLI